MKSYIRLALLLVAVVGGTFAGTVYNRVVVNKLHTNSQLAAEVGGDLAGTELVKVPLHAYSTRVLVSFEGNSTDIGTGNLIRNDLVITNWHNLRNQKGNNLQIELADGSKQAAKVLKKDQEEDLALIELSKPSILPNLSLADKEPAKGDVLTVSGWAKGKDYSETTGNVLGRRSPSKGAKDSLFYMDAAVKPGMSGSAALNAKGELSGVIFGCADEQTYGAGVDAVRAFLKGTKYWEGN